MDIVQITDRILVSIGIGMSHAQDAAGHAGGMEHFQIVQLFAGALELDGLAGDAQHRKCRAAAGIAIGLGP